MKLCLPGLGSTLQAWVGKWLTVGFILKIKPLESMNIRSSLNKNNAKQLSMLSPKKCNGRRLQSTRNYMYWFSYQPIYLVLELVNKPT